MTEYGNYIDNQLGSYDLALHFDCIGVITANLHANQDVLGRW